MTARPKLSFMVSLCIAAYFAALMCSNAGIQGFSGLLILLSFVCIFTDKKNKAWDFFGLVPRWNFYSILFFCFSGFLSLVVNLDDWGQIFSIMGKYRWLAYYLSFSYLLFVFFKKEWIKKSHAIYIISILVTALGIHQAYTGVEILAGKNFRLVPTGELFRSVGTFSIPLTFAYVQGMLFFGLLPQLFLFRKTFSKRRMIFLVAVCFSLLVSIFYSQTRGAWLALVLTLILFFLIYRPIRKYLVVLILFMVSAYFVGPVSLQKRVNSMVNITSDGSNTGRFDIWKGHYHLYEKSKVFGWGLLNNVENLQESYDELGIMGAQVNHAHNNYLHVLSAQGLVGFISFLVMIFAFVILSWVLCKKNDPLLQYVGLATFLIQVFVHLGGLTEATFLDQELNQQLVFCWGLVSAMFVRSLHPNLQKEHS